MGKEPKSEKEKKLTCSLVFISMKKKLKFLSMMNSTVPAPTYLTALAARTAASPNCLRTSQVMPGPGIFHSAIIKKNIKYESKRTWCFLDDLLVPPLHGAVPLEEVDVVVVLVAEHLDLDVPGCLDKLLQQHDLLNEMLF